MINNQVKAAVLAVILCGAAQGALAADDTAQRTGDSTRQWLELQTSGSAASPVERPMPGEVASKITKRYQDSFAHPLPDEFKRESFKSSGS
ncbi:DUF3613 domain-containing protein [Sinimarinibacterium sp. NLF-5-8]|uniref:DUF3613 domain-containing protein n=1 Tax=Sinimarinibacterium sp. NLF-5-8 TaxID=2698684 RepID=UPI00137BD5AC|nr:DUF3613 domain-containing protein [Sinimarinibacterium sp. NLF-5-8]QHS09317.1 DUF3613 domain-containing protein [Sinimarinibacterium sp. NLF-5-8]